MDVNEVIVGNVCSLCAMVTDSISSIRKKHNEILAIQTLSQLFYGAGSMILKGFSSTAQNVSGILRNLAAMKNVRGKVVEWFLISLGVVHGILFNNCGLVGWLPIAANLEYSIPFFRFKNKERSLKIAFMINMLMYSVFSVVIQNYVGAVANLFVAGTGTTLITLIREGTGYDG